ncbi:DUF4367 domain-containing protein [Clostridium sp. AF22-10]|nr:DUF4367 domain-containing protein [Clostridium sp. AF22-10]
MGNLNIVLILKFEYSANIVKGDTYYQISGIIPKKEFKKIVENLFLENY